MTTGHPFSMAAGSALIVTLVLVTILGLLAGAAMRAASLETLMTANLATWTQARLSAESALDIAMAVAEFPATGETRTTQALGPDAMYEAVVVTRFLGETNGPADAASNGSPTVVRHFEIVAEVRGPRSTHELRRRYVSVPRRASDPFE